MIKPSLPLAAFCPQPKFCGLSHEVSGFYFVLVLLLLHLEASQLPLGSYVMMKKVPKQSQLFPSWCQVLREVLLCYPSPSKPSPAIAMVFLHLVARVGVWAVLVSALK